MVETNGDGGTSAPGAPRLTFAEIIKRYPAVFGSPCRPLRIGVYDDLLNELGPGARGKLRVFLGWHTSRRAYLESLAAGGARYRLDGTPDGEVDEGGRQHALQRLQLQDDEKTAPWRRSKLRKLVQASGLSAYAYAVREGLDPDRTQSDFDKALSEHADRQTRREALVSALEASGMSVADFAARKKIGVPKLMRAIEKVRGSGGATADAPATATPSSSG